MIIIVFCHENFFNFDFDLIMAKEDLTLMAKEFEREKSWKLPFKIECYPSPVWEQIYDNIVEYSICHLEK